MFFSRFSSSCFIVALRFSFICIQSLTGFAWGTRVFRGFKYPTITRIDAGGKRDWRLIPKEDEEEFCKIDKVHEPKYRSDEVDTRLPPVLELVIKRNFKQRKVAFEGTPNLEGCFKWESNDLTKRGIYFDAHKSSDSQSV